MKIIDFIFDSVLEYSDESVSYYHHEHFGIIRIEWYSENYYCEIVPFIGY